ncbi:hypothetical protein NPIL_95621 [Nephila pilipes]|uniref:Uncharacterized protein n=1 Tax=Nephila pilipes TaxID=299642 RepID=A0A8X6U661_NEPPI|nr:hypothetical protein NPIL_95621 [Nephila pilipes]
MKDESVLASKNLLQEHPERIYSNRGRIASSEGELDEEEGGRSKYFRRRPKGGAVGFVMDGALKAPFRILP